MGDRETGATGLEPATSGVTGRRSNQLNYAPERRSDCSGGVIFAVRPLTASADLQGERRRLDRGRRHRPRRGQRLPARTRHRRPLARRALDRRDRRSTVRPGLRRRRQPVRPARRARRRGGRGHARPDVRRVGRPVGEEIPRDRAAAPHAGLRRRRRVRSSDGPRDLLDGRRGAALPARADRVSAARAGVGRRFDADRGAAAAEGDGRGGGNRPVRHDRRSRRRGRRARSGDREGRGRPCGAPLRRAGQGVRVRARDRGLRMDRSSGHSWSRTPTSSPASTHLSSTAGTGRRIGPGWSPSTHETTSPCSASRGFAAAHSVSPTPSAGSPVRCSAFRGTGRCASRRCGWGARRGSVPATHTGGIELGRPVVALRGDVRSGNSGGPIVNADGRVVGTVFARRRGSDDGFAVPNDRVGAAVANVGPALRTACVER